MFYWTDPDTGDKYEINYLVGQFPGERDHYVWRRVSPEPARPDAWHWLPPFVNSQDMEDIEKHFHG
jgi:hypothetical protein